MVLKNSRTNPIPTNTRFFFKGHLREFFRRSLTSYPGCFAIWIPKNNPKNYYYNIVSTEDRKGNIYINSYFNFFNHYIFCTDTDFLVTLTSNRPNHSLINVRIILS